MKQFLGWLGVVVAIDQLLLDGELLIKRLRQLTS